MVMVIVVRAARRRRRRRAEAERKWRGMVVWKVRGAGAEREWLGKEIFLFWGCSLIQKTNNCTTVQLNKYININDKILK